MSSSQNDSADSTDLSGEKTFRNSLYPALTRFYKAKACNYMPYVYCPNCGEAEDKNMDKHHVYLCAECGGEYYWSYYDKVMFVDKGSFEVFEFEDDGMEDGVPDMTPTP